MSKSKTPRTDAEVLHGDEPQFVLANFARILELELTRLRERCARLKRQRDWLRLTHVALAKKDARP
jgi:prophage antirepressor-like protein